MLRKVFRANIIYAVGSVANSAVLLLLVPYLVNSLTPTEFGTWSLLEVSILILNMVISAGLDFGLMREYWFLESEKQRACLAGTVAVAMITWGSVTTGILAGLAFTSKGGTERLIQAAPQTVLLGLLSAPFESLFAFTMTLFRMREEPIKFVGLSLGRLVLFMVSSIVLVEAGLGLNGAIGGRALAGLGALIVGMTLARRHISLGFDRVSFKRVAVYGLPLLPTNLTAYILLVSDRYFLQYHFSADVVGIYSFAYKIASVFEVIVNRPFALDWAPRRFKIATLKDAPRRYSDVLLVYLFVAASVALVIIALAPFVYDWIAPDIYSDGLKILPLLILAALTYGLYYPLTVGIVIKDKTFYAAVIGSIAALFCLGLNFWLVPRYGMRGAAWATVFSYAAWTGGMTVVSLCLYPIPYPPRHLLTICAAAAFGYAGLEWLMQLGGSSTLSLWALLIRLTWLAFVFGTVGIILLRRIREQSRK